MKLLRLLVFLLSFFILSCSSGDEANGPAGDTPEGDTEVIRCNSNAIRDVSCGLNDRGVRHQKCLENEWVDFDNCVDDDTCIDDSNETSDKSCGTSGTILSRCQSGSWVETCDEPPLIQLSTPQDTSSYLFYIGVTEKKLDVELVYEDPNDDPESLTFTWTISPSGTIGDTDHTIVGGVGDSQTIETDLTLYGPGDYTLTVKATDPQGKVIRKHLILQLVQPKVACF